MPSLPKAPPFQNQNGKPAVRWGTREFAFWSFLSLAFAQLALALAPSWSDGTYYDYGFLVPFLLPAFFLARWKEIAPPPDQLDRGLCRLASSWQVRILVCATFVAVVLLRLVEGADSGWRAPLYLHAAILVSLGAYLLHQLAGRRILSLWPCAVLVFLAVPLPSRIEFSLIKGLTDGVLDFALFTNRMTGLPLESSGETIIADGIPLHVSDGCSGIRSFQSGIFAGFVLGEFLRLGLISRALLVASGLALAFFMNGFRVIYLVRHAVAHPDADLQKVHDVSGYVSLTLTFVLIAATGWLLSKLAPAAGRLPSSASST